MEPFNCVVIITPRDKSVRLHMPEIQEMFKDTGLELAGILLQVGPMHYAIRARCDATSEAKAKAIAGVTVIND